MSDLQAELLKAGLITQKQYDAGKRQAEQQAAKDRRKMVKAADPTASFNSIRSLMDHIKKELRRDPTAANLRKLTREAHTVADQLNLDKRRRGKMHAFLAKVAEGLVSRLPDDRPAFLDEVFLTLDPKLVSEE